MLPYFCQSGFYQTLPPGFNPVPLPRASSSSLHRPPSGPPCKPPARCSSSPGRAAADTKTPHFPHAQHYQQLKDSGAVRAGAALSLQRQDLLADAVEKLHERCVIRAHLRSSNATQGCGCFRIAQGGGRMKTT
eukprot:358521-Chlamydomonas_euryale.AAC.5